MTKKAILMAHLFVFLTLGSFFVLGARPVLAVPCTGGGFFGLPAWFSHLECAETTSADPITGEETKSLTPQISGLNDAWKIVASVLEILLRIASLIAIGFVVFGGVTYILSQGSPDKTKQALSTIISAIVGLVITI
ncbi:hypothetical protein EBQ81_00470, partial [bacterium]|nr:hypothetical protein [bacterium]